jgi:hypothetical protein
MAVSDEVRGCREGVGRLEYDFVDLPDKEKV